MYNWNESVAIYLIQILGDSELVLHMMKDYICPKRRIWIEEDAREWHLSLRLNRLQWPIRDPEINILTPNMNHYLKVKSDTLMWTIRAFYGDFIRQRNGYEHNRNGQTGVVYFDDEATIKEKIDSLNKIFSEDRDWCEEDYLYPSMANVTESIEDYRDNVESGELEDTLPWQSYPPYICGMVQDCNVNYESSDRVDTIKIKRVELIDY